MAGHVRVKICGITRQEDADCAVRFGADALGFVFWPASPRAVKPDQARAIIASLPPFVARVGVFVNVLPEEVAEIILQTGINVVQLHGDEPPDRFAGLGVHLLKAVTVEDDDDVAKATKLPAGVVPLVDAVDRKRWGGTGQTADWGRAAVLAAERPVILAGGLSALNVRDGIRLVAPWAVDVSSGVEVAPGRKDAGLLEAFFAAVAAAKAEDQ